MKTKKIKEGDLHFLGRLPLEQIESLTFHIEKNNHAFLNITGLLDPEEGKEVMRRGTDLHFVYRLCKQGGNRTGGRSVKGKGGRGEQFHFVGSSSPQPKFSKYRAYVSRDDGYGGRTDRRDGYSFPNGR